VNSIWHRVTADFDFMVDEPGPVSGHAIDALLSFLGIEVTPPKYEYEWWAERVAAAATADPDRLLSALSTTELSRIAAFILTYSADPGPLDGVRPGDEPTRLALHIASGVHHGWAPGDDLASFGRAFGVLLASRPVEPDMVAALMLCTGAPGETLAELPWAEPGWDVPVLAVDSLLLLRAPAAHVEWLLAMAIHHPAEAPALADSAERTRDVTLVEKYGIALLAHEDASVRRAAVGRLSRRWHTDAYQDAVAALLTDPEVGDAAVDRLAHLGDRRARPY
jgi:hypothetical protein